MPSKMSPGAALEAKLLRLQPSQRPPADIFQVLLASAAVVSSPRTPLVIDRLLAASAFVDIQTPTGLTFPADHALHPRSGPEWYWFSANLRVAGDEATQLAVCFGMKRQPALPNALQDEAGWTDEETQVVYVSGTVVVKGPDGGAIFRRRPNVQWPMLGGDVGFGADPFLFRCGPDTLSGTLDVLPLAISIDDGDNMSVDLVMSTDMAPATAFFLEADGGVTPPPIPGTYYSWPQLTVDGTVTAGGISYSVTGKGWIDHQLFMQTPPPGLPNPILPPTYNPPVGFDGWAWCQFNLDNGAAFTASTFRLGPLMATAPLFNAYYLHRLGEGWRRQDLTGSLAVDGLVPLMHGMIQPTAWLYAVAPADGLGPRMTITPTPWLIDGGFETGDLAVSSEVPVSVTVGPPGALAGSGFCETVGAEPPAGYVERALAFLKARS